MSLWADITSLDVTVTSDTRYLLADRNGFR